LGNNDDNGTPKEAHNEITFERRSESPKGKLLLIVSLSSSKISAFVLILGVKGISVLPSSSPELIMENSILLVSSIWGIGTLSNDDRELSNCETNDNDDKTKTVGIPLSSPLLVIGMLQIVLIPVKVTNFFESLSA
jgi:hypothetical protein